MNELIETAPQWLPGIAAMGLLIVASGFFSGSETALFYLSRDELRKMHTGSSGERLAAALMRNPDRLLTAVLFWNLLINLAYFAVSIVIAKRLVETGHTAIAGVLSAAGLIGIIICGEVVPKSFAVIFRRQVAVWASWPLALAVRILQPILPFLGTSTLALRRALWPDLKFEPYLHVDDIERAVETSDLGLELVRLEQQILGKILDLSDITAEELMRPRGSYAVWSDPLDWDRIRKCDDPLDYVLIAGDDGDTVVKAIAMRELSHVPDQGLESLAEDVVFIPWCGTVAETLGQLRTSVVSVACVINEYGETVGIITEEDILDTLLNPHSSRTQRLLERDPVEQTANGWVANGLTTLRHLAERLGFEFEPGDDGLLTVVALMHDKLERFPQAGDRCTWEGYELTVIRAREPGESIQVSIQQDASSLARGKS